MKMPTRKLIFLMFWFWGSVIRASDLNNNNNNNHNFDEFNQQQNNGGPNNLQENLVNNNNGLELDNVLNAESKCDTCLVGKQCSIIPSTLPGKFKMCSGCASDRDPTIVLQIFSDAFMCYTSWAAMTSGQVTENTVAGSCGDLAHKVAFLTAVVKTVVNFHYFFGKYFWRMKTSDFSFLKVWPSISAVFQIGYSGLIFVYSFLESNSMGPIARMLMIMGWAFMNFVQIVLGDHPRLFHLNERNYVTQFHALPQVTVAKMCKWDFDVESMHVKGVSANEERGTVFLKLALKAIFDLTFGGFLMALRFSVQCWYSDVTGLHKNNDIVDKIIVYTNLLVWVFLMIAASYGNKARMVWNYSAILEIGTFGLISQKIDWLNPTKFWTSCIGGFWIIMFGVAVDKIIERKNKSLKK